MKFLIAAIALLAATAAIAQPAPQLDPAVAQRALEVLALQRNQAMNNAASAEVRAAGLADELGKAQARIKELEPKAAKPEGDSR